MGNQRVASGNFDRSKSPGARRAVADASASRVVGTAAASATKRFAPAMAGARVYSAQTVAPVACKLDRSGDLQSAMAFLSHKTTYDCI